jgi:hypothetical protein
MPSCCECEAIDRHFAADWVARELATYARRGPIGTARVILNSLSGIPLIDSVLDIGAGIGVLHHELLNTGSRSAVHVEAASAYLARAPSVASADLVTLDRVVCCYAAFEPLIRLSAEKARRYYALSFPHDRWYMRAHTRWQNYRRKRSGNFFRTFIHPSPRSAP